VLHDPRASLSRSFFHPQHVSLRRELGACGLADARDFTEEILTSMPQAPAVHEGLHWLQLGACPSHMRWGCGRKSHRLAS
jgi:hypothetical protein